MLILVFLGFLLKKPIHDFAKNYAKISLEKVFKTKAELENISFEPFGLKLKLSKINLENVAFLESLEVDFAFSDLLKKEIHISQIHAKGLRANIVKKGQKFLINGLSQKDDSKNKGAIQNNWRLKIDKIELVNSEISLNDNRKIEIKKAEIFNFNSAKSQEIEFKILAAIQDSKMAFDGKISQKNSLVNFELSDFDLEIANLFLDKKNSDFGKIKGKLASRGAFEFKDQIANLSLDLELKNLFFYSKDLTLISYFLQDLEVKNLNLNISQSLLKISSSSLTMSHLLFSVLSKDFQKKRLSKFSKIRIDKINFSKNQKNKTTKAIFHFKNGGFFALNQYQAGNKEMIDVKVNHADLTQFSSAFEPLLNYHIESGKMSLDAKTITENNNIKGDVKLIFSQLSLDSENELGEELKSQSLIPLKTAISMIKDGNGNVELDFKIYGQKNDPNFDILKMLGKGAGSMAISKISSIVATKLAVKFTPILVSSLPLSPSNAFMFVNGAYKLITKPRFKDVNFISLESEIKNDSQENLSEVLKFLKENKKIKLLICPVASRLEFGDEKVSDEKVLSLANQRVKTLKSYFTSRNDNGALDQMIFCRPKISEDKNIAQAEISI